MPDRAVDSPPPLLVWALATYRVALRIHPATFRRTFGAELLHDFEVAMEERWLQSGWPGLFRLWRGTTLDAFHSAIAQWTREGWAIAAVFTTLIATAAVGASWHVYRGAWSRVQLRGDDDVAIVLVAASAVLLVLVCPLVFTAVIIRPRRRAQRRT